MQHQQPGIHEGWLIVPIGQRLFAMPLWLAVVAILFVVGCMVAVCCAIAFGRRRRSESSNTESRMTATGAGMFTGREMLLLGALGIMAIGWWGDHRYLATALLAQQQAVVHLQKRLEM